MKHFIWVVACLATWVGVTVEAAEPIRLRVLSYNIHHAEGVERKLDVDRIAQVIRRLPVPRSRGWRDMDADQ